MSMQGFMQDREDRLAQARSLEARAQAERAWAMPSERAERRLLLFDRWVRLELEARLDWSKAGEQKARRLEQCRIELENLVLALELRGWHLDGHSLAGHIRDALNDVGKAQREGRVKDFWPFFKSVVDRYVGVNAEEIREEAMSAGAHVGQVLGDILRAQTARERSMPELIKERRKEQGEASLRARLAQERRDDARHEADARQGQLF